MAAARNAHTDPIRLELYVIAREEITEREILRIESHLQACPACRTAASALAWFYRNVEKLIASAPSGPDRDVTLRYCPPGHRQAAHTGRR